MPKSMTGFGKSDIAIPQMKVSFEIRSVNSKYLDLSLNLPESISHMDMDLRSELSQYIKRGRVTVNVTFSDERETGLRVKSDLALALDYKEAIEEVGRAINRPIAPTALDIVNMPGVLTLDNLQDEADDEFLQVFNESLSQAIENFEAHREREGEKLFEYIKSVLAELEILLERIDCLAKNEPERVFKKLDERVRVLLMDKFTEIDEDRMLQELAILADKRDISEEISRLESHIEACYLLENREDAIGKEFDFLAQEMMRESNTMASKTSDSEILRLVIGTKALVEKIREQVQNLE